MSEATPRITAPYLEQFSHQTVRILGKVRQLRGEQATIDAGGQISVFLNRVCHCLLTKSGPIQAAIICEFVLIVELFFLAGLTPTAQPCCRDHRQGPE